MPLPLRPNTGHRSCRRCHLAEPDVRFNALARTICRPCRVIERSGRAPRPQPTWGTVAEPPAPRSPAGNDAHLAFVRSKPCSVKAASAPASTLKPCLGIMHAHHVRMATGGGMGMKPDDRWCVPLCGYHHAELHTRGARTFEARYGVDLRAKAERLAAASPSLNQNEADT